MANIVKSLNTATDRPHIPRDTDNVCRLCQFRPVLNEFCNGRVNVSRWWTVFDGSSTGRQYGDRPPFTTDGIYRFESLCHYVLDT